MKKTLTTLIIVCMLTIESFAQKQICIYGDCVNGFGAQNSVGTIYYIGEFKDSTYNGCGVFIITTTDSWYYGLFENGQLIKSLSKSYTQDYLIAKYRKRNYLKSFKKCKLKYDLIKKNQADANSI